MKLGNKAVFAIFLGTLLFGATGVLAAPPPPPPGMHLAPGMVWCPRCGGHGRVPSGFLGLNDKRCPECKGYRMLAVHGRHHAAPVPPPAPAPHHHHAAPAPVHHHAQPARPMPPPAPVRRGPVYR